MNVQRTLVALLLAAVTAGGSSGAAQESEATTPPLAGTRWRLVEVQSMDDAQGTSRPAPGTLYTMALHGDGTVTLQLNCNRALGTWSAEPSSDPTNGRFTFGPLAATLALCPPPSLDASFLARSSAIRSYSLQNGRLSLSLLADGGNYVWVPEDQATSGSQVAAAPEHGGSRNWEVVRPLTLREQASPTARVLTTVPPGSILDNLGCQRVQDQTWCDLQPLGGGPRGYGAAELLRPALSPDGSAAMGPDDSALRAGQGQFDATGPLPCAFAASQPMGSCRFGVARAGGGYATVVITRPGGRTRAIFFRMGRAIGADTSESEGAKPFAATREGDLTRIRIGEERYEIPDAVVLGG
ncbi:MAG: META domain-containing protein [Synechococcus sp.]